MAKMSWIDVRSTGDQKEAILEEAIHQGVDGVVVGALEDASDLPPTVIRIAFAQDEGGVDGDLGSVDVVVFDSLSSESVHALREEPPDVEVAKLVKVSDQQTLDAACRSAETEKWTVLEFEDPTKIPLEIVLASANNSEGSVITIVKDLEEAEIVLGVLERGSDGVMLAPGSVGDAAKLKEVCETESASLELEELEVKEVTHVGMGDRACVDTCSYLNKDEGILVGSRSSGMVLACSETHPLPYMPTRPFRVNAGAIHSYALSIEERTNYLSELESGSKILAVNHEGKTRKVVVGRVKIESRPLLSIDAVSESGMPVNLIVQDDWHVRLIGPGAAVLNVTEIKPGDKVLGYVMHEERHVGLPVDEFAVEQ